MLQAGPSMAVIGAAGFIGGALADRLGRDGIPCERFTRSTPLVLDGGLAPGLATADVVFWLASSISPAVRAESGHATGDQSSLRVLLEGLADLPRRPPRVIAVSSGGTVYDHRQPPPYAESSPTRGANDYGEAMLAVEALIRDLAPDYVVLRASNAYGPGQPARRGQGVVAHWLRSLQLSQPVVIIGDPATRRDYLYIDDLVDALLAAADRVQAPNIVNVGSGRGTSLAELAHLLPQVVERPVTVEYAPSRGFDAPSTWLDVSLAKAGLGFEAAVGLEEGLRRTWRSIDADTQ